MSRLPRMLAMGVLGGGTSVPPPINYTTHIDDEFTDADGTLLTSHAIAPTNLLGASWLNSNAGGVNVPTIYNNRVEFSAVSGNNQIAYFNAGQSDLTISAVWRVTGNETFRYASLIGRCSTSGNGWMATVAKSGSFTLRELSGWAGSTVHASTTVTPSANTNYDFILNFNGDVITATFNGVSITYTSALYQTQTRVALLNYNGTLDNFQVITPPL